MESSGLYLPYKHSGTLTAKDFSPGEIADFKKIYRFIVLTRIADSTARVLFRQGRFYGTYYSALGMEASVVVPAYFSKQADFAATTVRELGCCIVKGMPIESVFAQIFCKKSADAQGKNEPHLFGWTPARIFRNYSYFSSHIPIATGAALANKLQDSDGCALCYMGEGVTAKGDFHEALNFAGIHKLPIVFVILNNWYAGAMRIETTSAVSDISAKAESYGINGIRVDGNDAPRLYKVCKDAFESARKGNGSTLIQCDTYRWYGASEIDPTNYRPAEEVELWKEHDPLVLLENWLMENGVLDNTEIDRITEE